MKQLRKKHNPPFKARVALEALKGEEEEMVAELKVEKDFLKLSQNSLFKADTYVRPIAESGILGMVLTGQVRSLSRERRQGTWENRDHVSKRVLSEITFY